MHCSDLHLRYLGGTRLAELCNKRVTGALNLVVARSKKHRDSRWPSLVEKAKALDVDHVLISGDLINLGMKREFDACAQALAEAGCSFYVVPGNHDIYLAKGDALGEFRSCFSPYLGPSLTSSDPFPYAVDLGPIRLFGLNSSVGRPWFMADGQLGDRQLSVFADALAQAHKENKRCVVMLHHPVTEAASRPRRDLVDRAQLTAILATHGAELVLHGHEHRELEGFLPGPDGSKVLVHGVASATACSIKPERMGAFTLYEITDSDFRYQRFRCETPDDDQWTRVNPSSPWISRKAAMDRVLSAIDAT